MPSNSNRWVAILMPVFCLLSFGDAISVGQVNQEQKLVVPKIIEDENEWPQGPRLTRQGMRESIFSQLGGSEAAFQRSRREKIRREVDRIHSVCNLTSEQKEKLDTAIEIDIQHLLTRIETILARYDTKMSIQQYQQMQTDVQRLVGALPSKESEPEIWRKVLQSQLTEQQKEMMIQDSLNIEKNQLRTERLKILLSLQRKLGLTQLQRTALFLWLEKQDRDKLNFYTLWGNLAKSQDDDFRWTASQRELLDKPLARTIIPSETIPVDLQPVIIKPGVLMK